MKDGVAAPAAVREASRAASGGEVASSNAVRHSRASHTINVV